MRKRKHVVEPIRPDVRQQNAEAPFIYRTLYTLQIVITWAKEIGLTLCLYMALYLMIEYAKR